MRTPRRLALLASSSLVVLVLAGSALALGTRGTVQAANQKSCANGSVKAIAVVVADPTRGFMKSYTSAPSFFKTRWSCKKATFQARRVDRGVYDVRVLGNTGGTPLIMPIGTPIKVGVTPLPDGGIQVNLIGEVPGGSGDYAVDQNFIVVWV